VIANAYDTIAVLVLLAAAFGYLNYHYIRLPFAIGMMATSFTAAVALLILDVLFPAVDIASMARSGLQHVNFTEAVLHVMLGFLLFAGSLHLDLGDMLSRKGPIAVLATVGVIISTLVAGFGAKLVFQLTGVDIPLAYCMVFGALISPTDPVAVLGIMRSAGAPRSLEVKVIGESLFNDGVGVIVFSLLLAVAAGGSHGAHGTEASGAGLVIAMMVREVVGGVVLGLAAGSLAYLVLRSMDEANLEILVSVALVMGITVAAEELHTSAPLACVIAGLFIGNHGRAFAMSERTRHTLDIVWSFIDEALNGLLFLLVGLEVLAVQWHSKVVLPALLMIPLVIVARYLAVLLPVVAMQRFYTFTPGAVKVLTWGGLKGGISVALALSLPAFVGRDGVLTATYAVVVFSIIVQGLTIEKVIRRLPRTNQEPGQV